MSQTRLHQLLNTLFESKDLSLIAHLYNHQDLKTFAEKFALKIPVQELGQVFVHTSFSHEFNVPHQENLEFLGDSVLQLILTDELYKRFSNTNEGHLSKLRSAIVNEKSLSAIAQGLGLQDLIIVGKGEFKKKLYEQAAVLADTFEALLAQVYRHHGLEFTRTLFLKWLKEFIPTAFNENFLDTFDAKSKLQEKVLAKYKKVPRYTAEQKGEEFEVTLWINEERVATGLYSSKKNGEKDLAQLILKNGNI
jgi:ribonuclease-3